MTIHSAKGLEFEYVFIAGVEEDLFPSKMALTSQEDLEEERRLFYVALTRAGKQAVVSYASRRYKWGTPAMCTPSRFIKDIEEKYINRPLEPVSEQEDLFGFDNNNNKPFEKKNREPASTKYKQNHVVKTEPPLNLNKKLVDIKTASRQQVANNEQFDADDTSKIKSGMIVYHQQFGSGKVVNIEGAVPNSKAVVFFEGAGEKKLLLKFARLKILKSEDL